MASRGGMSGGRETEGRKTQGRESGGRGSGGCGTGEREIVYRIGRRTGTIRVPAREGALADRSALSSHLSRTGRLWRPAFAPGKRATALAACALPVAALCAFLWLIRTLAAV